MSWNPVLDLVLEIKREYYTEFDDPMLEFVDWLEVLNVKKYNDIFAHLITNQSGNLLLIRYDLIDAPQDMWDNKDSIYRECRSVVIDLENECIALASMRKFFNINEVTENEIANLREEIANAENVEFSDKLDGSMQMARWYNGKVLMSGSMALDPKQSWRLEEGYSMLTEDHIRMLKMFTDTTFIFEYISEKDPHVVNYKNKEDGLYLIAMRNSSDGYEYEYNIVDLLVRTYKIKHVDIENRTLDEVLDLMKVYNSDEKEGWVMSIDGRRIKIKCDDYVNMHNILDRLASSNVIIKAVSDGNIDDIISKVPETHKPRVLDIVSKVRTYIANIKLNYTWYYYKAPKDNKKEFMTYVNNNVPKEYQAYVRNLYLDKPINPLMSQSGKYVKMKSINWLVEHLQNESR